MTDRKGVIEMKILFDAFGGDNAPLCVIKGAVDAKDEFGVDIVLVGDEAKIRQCAKDNNINITDVEIIHADDVITMEDSGSDILKSKKNSSMAVAMRALVDGKGDALISAGNSGALCVGATLIAKRIKGIKRPAFASIIPTTNGNMMLLDSGANVECRPEMLKQFGIMGSVYMHSVFDIESPRVGLANCGTEEHKGTQLQHEAYALLKESNINFIGNVEGRDIPSGVCDVLVCDGFTGNLILKTYEGVALSLMAQIKGIFKKSLKNKIAAAIVLNDMKELKKTVDYKEFGVAPILGCAKPVFKAHGSADDVTIKNSVKSVKKFIEGNILQTISKKLENTDIG